MICDITGLGAVASVGRSPADIFDALSAGICGRSPLHAFDPSKFDTTYAYEIDDRAQPLRDEPLRATQWLLTAIRQAVTEACLDDVSQCPILVGTTLREQRSVELWWRGASSFDMTDLDFGRALRSTFGTVETFTFANSCAASLYTLAMAADMIAMGHTDTVIVAGVDSITESAYGMFDRVQNKPTSIRPFDKARSGMLMGEGATAVVLQHPRAIRRPPLARVRGVSMNCDAKYPTAPDPTGVTNAIHEAYERAGVGAKAIDLVMLHGTGTELNDQVEAAVLANIFAPTTPGPLMTAVKSGTGHTLGGSGLLSLVTAVLAMSRRLVPPVTGLAEPVDEAADLRLVAGTSVTADVTTAQVNAFGLGGVNAVAIVESAL